MSAITIQQTPEQARLAFELHSHAEIASVRLQKARLERARSLDEPGGPILLSFSHRARRLDAPEGLLRLEIHFGLQGRLQRATVGGRKEKARPFALVEATWEVDYRLLEGYQPPPKTVKAFKDGNAIFNCWPYFREFVQSAVARMNLPPLTIPLLRLFPKLPAKKSAAPPAGGSQEDSRPVDHRTPEVAAARSHASRTRRRVRYSP